MGVQRYQAALGGWSIRQAFSVAYRCQRRKAMVLRCQAALGGCLEVSSGSEWVRRGARRPLAIVLKFHAALSATQ